MQPRHFTVDEVNRLIPRLEELLPQLREALRQMVVLARQLGQTVRQKSDTNGFHITQENQARALQEQADDIVARFRQLAQDVAELGAEIKDPETGLVDFRSLRQGREIHLCWRLGEPECAWWHDLEAGFQGRQPIE